MTPAMKARTLSHVSKHHNRVSDIETVSRDLEISWQKMQQFSNTLVCAHHAETIGFPTLNQELRVKFQPQRSCVVWSPNPRSTNSGCPACYRVTSVALHCVFVSNIWRHPININDSIVGGIRFSVTRQSSSNSQLTETEAVWSLKQKVSCASEVRRWTHTMFDCQTFQGMWEGGSSFQKQTEGRPHTDPMGTKWTSLC